MIARCAVYVAVIVSVERSLRLIVVSHVALIDVLYTWRSHVVSWTRLVRNDREVMLSLN